MLRMEEKDPYREWTTNTTSHRLALKNLDGDNGEISSAIAGTMTAIPYRGSGNINLPDTLCYGEWKLKMLLEE